MYAIESKIQDVYSTTERIIVDTSKESFEESTNRYLDTILHYKGKLESIIVKFEDLNESLINEIENSEEVSLFIKDSLILLLSTANKLIATIKRSEINDGLKSVLRTFSENTRHLKEIVADIDLKYVDLPKNLTINNLLSGITQ